MATTSAVAIIGPTPRSCCKTWARGSFAAITDGRHRRTLAADKAYDTADFVAACRALGVTPHVAQNTSGRRSAIDGRTTRHAGYGLSLKIRAWIETHFGWLKAAAGLRQVKQRGLERVDALFQLAMAASNLVRLPKLLAAGTAA